MYHYIIIYIKMGNHQSHTEKMVNIVINKKNTYCIPLSKLHTYRDLRKYVLIRIGCIEHPKIKFISTTTSDWKVYQPMLDNKFDKPICSEIRYFGETLYLDFTY